jgi:hypothetical protein
MNERDEISPIGNELAQRAPTALIFTNWRLWHFGAFIVFGSLMLAAAGVYLSLSYSDWGFLSRFGALEVILGSYLIGRPVWRRRFKSRFVTVTILTGGQVSGGQLAEYIMERTDIWFFYMGFVIAALGSVAWGFADLLNCFVPGYESHCATSAFGSR